MPWNTEYRLLRSIMDYGVHYLHLLVPKALWKLGFKAIS